MSAVIPRLSRLTQVLLLLLVIGVWGVLLLLWFSRTRFAGDGFADRRFDLITTQRLNIVDADGKPRLVISNATRFPEAVVRGKTYKRSIADSAGILFYDTDGNETGGLAIAKDPTERRYVALIFDYTQQPTDGVGIVKLESPDGREYSAGLSVNDRRPYNPAGINSQGTERVTLGTKNGDAELIISDTEGKPRILLGVDQTNTARLEIRDADGKIQHRYPPQ